MMGVRWIQLAILGLAIVSQHSCAQETEKKKYVATFKQPTGPSVEAECFSKDMGKKIDCPEHQEYDNDYFSRYVERCATVESSVNMRSVTCAFFQFNYTTGGKSCHHPEKKNAPTLPCMYGFKIRPTKQQRKGNADDAFVTIEFYGKIPPIPRKGKPNRKNKEFDVAEWIAIGLTKDEVMGDDLVLYCHPYMDRGKFPRGGGRPGDKYPDDIGVAINKYYTPGNGKQAYDADKSAFGKENGIVRKGKVLYHEYKTGGTPGNPSWGVLFCKAEVSTFILMKSKMELFTGIELDMEKTTRTLVFMAVGQCLEPECVGDHPNNTEEFRRIARRTTPLAFHKKTYVWKEHVTLFQVIERDSSGAVNLVMAWNPRQLGTLLALLHILNHVITRVSLSTTANSTN